MASASGPLEIRFNTAATDWESQALPVGNSRMGAMIYGDAAAERMQFNEISLWTGGANLSGGYDINQFGAYQTFGDLYLDTPGVGAPVVSNPTIADHTAGSAGQTVDKSYDGSTNTKWCIIHNSKTIIWQIVFPTSATLTGYSITSADDVPARDPRTWTFQGSNDGTTWTTLDSRALSTSSSPVWPFPSRRQKVSFTPASTGSFTRYRFVFTPNTTDPTNGSAVPHFQLSEIGFTGAPAAVLPTNYSRALDLTTAVHTVAWTQGTTNFNRETFASRPGQVIATRISADSSGKINTVIRLAGGHSETPAASGNEVSFSGTLSNNSLRYATKVRVIATGGTLTVSGNTLQATNCDSLLLLHAAATDYAMDAATTPAFRNGILPMTTVNARLDAAQTAGYAALKAAHIADYQSLFNRVSLDLGAPPAQTLTPSRLSAYQAGGTDNHLESLMFQFGRYLLISSSRDSLPANLQGLWNNSNNPPWFSDYHTNINLQMNYWMAEPANLPECHEPLFNFLEAIEPLSRTATKAGFGSTIPGWTMRTSVNPFGGHGWNWDTPSSAWLARHYWEHYQYSGDTAFLQNTAWPTMKEICQFWIARLKTRADGKLVSPNGWSPEHGPTEDGVSYDQEIIWDLFTNTIAASQVLDIEPTFRAQLIDLRSKLLLPGIGSWGQVMEWTTERPTLEHEGHRHTSHLYAAYPGFQFNPVDTPQYVTASAVSLLDRGTTGDSRRSWTWPWRAALWSRLGNAENAHDMVRGLFTYNTMQNLFTTHTPFQIDGNLGYPGAVCEMLLQSHAGEIAVLPALPSAWPAGSFTGLRARGGYEVDASWQGGAPTAVTLRSTGGQAATLRLPATITSPGAFVRTGNTTNAVTKRDGLLVFNTTPGQSYAIDTNVTGADDADGDGFSTYAEWLAGTDPGARASHPHVSLTPSPGGLTLSWSEIKDRRYVIQSSTDLQTWSDVITRDTTSAGTGTLPITPGSGRVFYRAVIRTLPD
ncbi:glycoside hydrolase N-terminal domain-containing protein [Luteolibacter ambystomatis]|uniref:Glycoside hydrolase N-terminal domain-containing protein n=1 Tax=Luteolibacter ambystomatis TaxID=2824561 RepID=A0A975G9D5_9BACT|nr:glycoside hydrolase N-terminal domain-containing protein [Luteolibacter ambystomatis]QUE51125.1 glycoside hydrolase N-terminal domain-containing protein [Luteolibacter ambystomatis]